MMNQEQTAHESGHTTSGGTSGGEKMNAADAPATADKSNGTTAPTADDANESGGAPVPDDKKDQTGKADTAAATKAGAGASLGCGRRIRLAGLVLLVVGDGGTTRFVCIICRWCSGTIGFICSCRCIGSIHLLAATCAAAGGVPTFMGRLLLVHHCLLALLYLVEYSMYSCGRRRRRRYSCCTQASYVPR